jgi:hypothetical protein
VFDSGNPISPNRETGWDTWKVPIGVALVSDCSNPDAFPIHHAQFGIGFDPISRGILMSLALSIQPAGPVSFATHASTITPGEGHFSAVAGYRDR